MNVAERQRDVRSSTLAYLAGSFPKRSETFVYREVRALRQRHFDVVCATLHPSATVPEHADDLVEDLVTVYSAPHAAQAALEFITQPLAALGTLGTSVADAFNPGEPTSLSSRLKLVGQAAAALGLARSLRKRKVSHIHAHFAHAPTTLAMYAARQLRVPFSFTGHANDIFQRRSLLRRKLERAAFVACISEWHREFYRDKSLIANAPVIRCGVDTEVWQPPARAAEGQSPLRLVTLCRLVEKKGVDILLRALPLMSAPATLVIAGDGPEEERLRSLCRDLGCSDRVTWLGAIENSRAREVLQAADVFVLPCRTDENGDRDGIPVVLMEAMACGLVAVSGDIPSVRELITNEVSGFLLTNDDPKGLAQLLDRLATSPLSDLRKNGRARVVEEFSLSANIDRLIARLQGDSGGSR